MREETRCHHTGYSFRLTPRVLLYAPSHRQDSTYHSLCYTSREALAGTRSSSMGPPWRIDPTTHRTMSEHSYHGSTSRSAFDKIISFVNNVLFSAEQTKTVGIVTRWFHIPYFIRSIHDNIRRFLYHLLNKKYFWISRISYISTHVYGVLKVPTSKLVPASAPWLVYQRPWYVLSCLWDGAYKRTLAVNWKDMPMWWQRVSSLTIRVVLYHTSDVI